MPKLTASAATRFPVGLLSVLLFMTSAWAGANAPGPAAAESVLYSAQITATAEDEEFRVAIRARAPNTSWEIEGHESAMLRVVVDGNYDQHIFLFQGVVEADYQFLVGPLSRGTHAVRIEWDRSWLADHNEIPEVKSAAIQSIGRSDSAEEPVLRAPILHIRKDTVGRFSDVPLVLYAETDDRPQGRLLTYTVILSNEDGGTNSERLMARWGRTTDIEWCYAYSQDEGTIQETYQARDHKTLPFRGNHEGWHPVLYVATKNNNFADFLPDPAIVRVRMIPTHVVLAGRAREAVMDLFPWTYAIMAKEMEREGKIEEPGEPQTAKLSDPRNYAYLELCAQQNGTELYFELQVQGQSRLFNSDHGDSGSRIGRSGCFRSTIELAPGARAEDLLRLRIYCTPAPVAEGEKPVRAPRVDVKTVNRLFLLQPDYKPGVNRLEAKIGQRLRPGKSLTVEIHR